MHTPGSCLILLLTFCDNWKVMVQVESMEGVEAIPDIAKVPGVDGIFLGKQLLGGQMIIWRYYGTIGTMIAPTFWIHFLKLSFPVSNYNRSFRLVV